MQQEAKTKQAKRSRIYLHIGRLLADDRAVLDIGCYTGLSALAWYEGTKDTQAKVTIANLGEVHKETYGTSRSTPSSVTQSLLLSLGIRFPEMVLMTVLK